MLEFFSDLLRADYMPHGHCYFWEPEIVWLHVLSDALIASAYYSIPIALLYFVHRRRDVSYRRLLVLFGLFILACGTTHVMAIVTLWNPIYRLDGVLKAATAGLSVATAAVLWPLVPKALSVPSAAQLEEANRELAATNARLVETERAKDEFVASVSHELRTPLTLILAPVVTMLEGRGTMPPNEQTRLLETVHNNSIRLLQMVNGLLDFSRLEAGRAEVKRHSVDLVSLSRRVVEDFEPIVARKELEMAFVAPPDFGAVSIDPYLYERIMFNLLSNAVKFTPAGGRIDVSLARHDGRIRLAVQDTGIGITADQLDGLFQKFRQLDATATRRFEGTGLGLALVKEFTELLGGSVSVESDPEEGSCFTVELNAPMAGELPEELPARSVRPTDLRANTEPAAGSPGASADAHPDGVPRVLVVEDNPDLAQYVRSTIAGECAVRCEVDGRSALQAVSEWQPDLVISDVMIPEIDGLALCRTIKSDPATQHIPVVLLTALTHREALLRGWKAGADDYLFKPFHPEELSTRIRTLLALVEQRREAEDLRVQKAALERSNRELQDYAYVVAHDLQEPLRKIHMFGDRLRTEAGDAISPHAGDYLERMLKAVPRMQALIDDLLAYSRVTTAARPFDVVDLDVVVREACEDLQLSADDADTRLDIGPLPCVRGDRVQLGQLFRNLIANAVKFRRPGAPAVVRIRAQAASGGSAQRVSVEDEGLGFDPAKGEEIFKIFYRLHAANEYPGTGMGLALCRRIVERHGGTIAAEGRPEAGATFTVTLPGPDAEGSS